MAQKRRRLVESRPDPLSGPDDLRILATRDYLQHQSLPIRARFKSACVCTSFPFNFFPGFTHDFALVHVTALRFRAGVILSLDPYMLACFAHWSFGIILFVNHSFSCFNFISIDLFIHSYIGYFNVFCIFHVNVFMYTIIYLYIFFVLKLVLFHIYTIINLIFIHITSFKLILIYYYMILQNVYIHF